MSAGANALIIFGERATSSLRREWLLDDRSWREPMNITFICLTLLKIHQDYSNLSSSGGCMRFHGEYQSISSPICYDPVPEVFEVRHQA